MPLPRAVARAVAAVAPPPIRLPSPRPRRILAASSPRSRRVLATIWSPWSQEGDKDHYDTFNAACTKRLATIEVDFQSVLETTCMAQAQGATDAQRPAFLDASKVIVDDATVSGIVRATVSTAIGKCHGDGKDCAMKFLKPPTPSSPTPPRPSGSAAQFVFVGAATAAVSSSSAGTTAASSPIGDEAGVAGTSGFAALICSACRGGGALDDVITAGELPLLHIVHARQDDLWVRGLLIPALGLEPHQYRTRSEDTIGAYRVDEIARAVKTCHYTLLVASDAARTDAWVQLAATLAHHAGLEDDKPRLIVVDRDVEGGAAQARAELPLAQRCLVYLRCTPADRERALANLARQLALAAKVETSLECPYPGLRMFGEGGDAEFFTRTDLFFGRNQEVDAIVERIRAGQRRLLVVGPSGSGKSSLIRARVLPALRADGFAIQILRPGERPDLSLRAAADALDPAGRLGATIDGASPADPALPPGLAVASSDRPDRRRRLVYIDQLEEAFTTAGPAARHRFFRMLTVLWHLPAHAVLLTLRADFYADLMRSPDAWADLKPHRLELEPLRGAALRDAIVRPAEAVGVCVEADLVERLVREADADRASEALPLLQAALEQLWRKREWRYLSLRSYEHLADGERRGLDVALARHADAALSELAPAEQVIARRLLIDLVQLGEGRPHTRRRQREDALRRAGDDPARVARVLAHLAARRLVTVGCESDGPAAERYVDLAHDALITGWGWPKRADRPGDERPGLVTWIKERHVDLQEQRRVESRAQTRGLLDDSELPEFERWLAKVRRPDGAALGASDALVALVTRSREAQRFRRRRRRIILGLLLTLSLVLGLTTFGLLHVTADLRSERKKTGRSIAAAVRVADQIVVQIDRRLQPIAGTSKVRAELLPRARALLDELRQISSLVDGAEQIAVMNKLQQGDLALERGKDADADLLYREALALTVKRLARRAADPTWKRLLARTYRDVGDVAVRAGRLGEARQWFVKALATIEEVAAMDPTQVDAQRDLSRSYDRLGRVTLRGGKLDAARAWFERSIAVTQALVDADPSNPDLQRALAASHRELGVLVRRTGRLDEAEQWYERSVAVTMALGYRDPTNADWQRDLSASYELLGEAAVQRGTIDRAQQWFEKALAVCETLAAADPTNTTWQQDRATLYGKLGDIAVSYGRVAEAWSWFERSLALAESLAGAEPAIADWQRRLLVPYERLGDMALKAGVFDEARRWYAKGLAVIKARLAADVLSVDWQRSLSIAYRKLGELSLHAGAIREAQPWFEKALAAIEALAATDPSNAEWQWELSIAYERLGNVALRTPKLTEAQQWFDRSLTLRTAMVAADPSNGSWQRGLMIAHELLAMSWIMNGAVRTQHLRASFEIYERLRTKGLFQGDPVLAAQGRQLASWVTLAP